MASAGQGAAPDKAEIGEVVRRMARRLIEQEEEAAAVEEEDDEVDKDEDEDEENEEGEALARLAEEGVSRIVRSAMAAAHWYDRAETGPEQVREP